jgi:hypothetical protein
VEKKRGAVSYLISANIPKSCELCRTSIWGKGLKLPSEFIAREGNFSASLSTKLVSLLPNLKLAGGAAFGSVLNFRVADPLAFGGSGF